MTEPRRAAWLAGPRQRGLGDNCVALRFNGSTREFRGLAAVFRVVG